MNLPELQDYRVDELIGEGPFGLVFRCTFRGQEQRVVKYLKVQAVNPGLLNSCFRGLSGREVHPGLTVVFEHDFVTHPFHYTSPLFGWKDADSGEWVSNSLERHLGRLEPDAAHHVVDQLAAALCFLHRRDVIHAGLKPSNVFVTGRDGKGPQIKIADWGQGYVTGLQYLEMGDLGFYAAPEQLDNGIPAGGAGKRWDVYSFGVVAYQLLTGRLPRLEDRYQEHLKTDFDHVPATAFGSVLESPERYLDWIVDEAGIEWPAEPGSERDARRREIIGQCLAVDPRERFADMRDVESAFAMADQKLRVAQLEDRARAGEQSLAKKEAEAREAREKEEQRVRKLEEELAQNSQRLAKREEEAREREEQLTRKHKEELERNSQRLAKTEEQVRKQGEQLVLKYEEKLAKSEARLARKGDDKGGARVRRWKVLALGSAVLCLAVAAAAGVLFAKLQTARGELLEDLTGARKTAEKQRESMSGAFQQLGNQLSEAAANLNEKDAELQAREAARMELAEAMRQQMRQSKELIRESQKNGDRFFEMVLENRHSELPGYEAKRLERLNEARMYYQSLLAVYGDASDFIDASAKAARYLGEIYLELGNHAQAAEYFAVAEQQLRKKIGESPEQVDFLGDLAIVRKRQGFLLHQRRELAPALQALLESNDLWRRIHEKNPTSQNEVIEVGEDFLLEAEIRKELGDNEGRRLVIQSAMETFMALQDASPDHHRVVGGLAKATELSAKFLAESSQTEEALKTYQQAADLFGRAIRLNASVSDYQIGLAENLAAIALLKDDTGKLEEAAKVLSEVASAPNNRSNGTLQKALSDCYGRLAEQQRDGGNTAEAIKWEQQAASILKAALTETRGTQSAPLVRFALAQRKCHLAELQGDLKNFTESGKTLTEALILLTALLEAEPANPAFRRQYALAQGQMGFATQQTGDNAEARTHYEAARDHWKSYSDAFPDDPQASEAVDWTIRQIEALP